MTIQNLDLRSEEDFIKGVSDVLCNIIFNFDNIGITKDKKVFSNTRPIHLKPIISMVFIIFL